MSNKKIIDDNPVVITYVYFYLNKECYTKDYYEILNDNVAYMPIRIFIPDKNRYGEHILYWIDTQSQLFDTWNNDFKKLFKEDNGDN